MKKSKKILFASMAVIVLSLIIVSSSYAVTIFGNGALGNFEGSFSYSASNSTNAIISIVLKNTSPVGNGGYLTAFVFNNPANRILTASLISDDADFGILGATSFDNSVNGAPYGQFDIGASTGGSFEGGGPPQKGIAVGVTNTFNFTVTGIGLDTLTDLSFLYTNSTTGTGAGEGYQPFVARFRGFPNEGSDKVPDDFHNTVPEPATLSLLGLGLLGMMGFKARKKIK